MNKFFRKTAGWSDGRAGDWIDQTLAFGNGAARGFLSAIPLVGNLALKGVDAVNNSQGNAAPSAGTLEKTKTAAKAGDIVGKTTSTGLQLAAGGAGLWNSAKHGINAMRAATAGKGFLGTMKMLPQVGKAGVNWYLKQLPRTANIMTTDIGINGFINKMNDPSKGWIESFGSAAKDTLTNPMNYIAYPLIEGAISPIGNKIIDKVMPLGMNAKRWSGKWWGGKALRFVPRATVMLAPYEFMGIGKNKEEDTLQEPMDDYYAYNQQYPSGYGMYPSQEFDQSVYS